MHLQADFTAVQDAGHVGRNNGIYAGGFGSIQCVVCRLQIFPVKGDIQRHIGLDSVRTANAHNLRQVFPAKIICRV